MFISQTYVYVENVIEHNFDRLHFSKKNEKQKKKKWIKIENKNKKRK